MNGQWIDVKTAILKSGVEFLGAIATVEGKPAEYIDIVIYSRYGYWMTAFDLEQVSTVTHIMPLPELP